MELIFHLENATIRSKAQMLFPMWATQGWMQPFRFLDLAGESREILDAKLKAFIGEAKGLRQARRRFSALGVQGVPARDAFLVSSALKSSWAPLLRKSFATECTEDQRVFDGMVTAVTLVTGGDGPMIRTRGILS